MGLVHERPALLGLAEPEKVLRELDARGGELRVKRKRTALRGGGIGEAVVARELLADAIVHVRIGRPGGESLRAVGRGPVGLVLELLDDRAQREGVGLKCVDRKNFSDRLAGEVVLLGLEQVPRHQQERGDVALVAVEGLPGVVEELLRIAAAPEGRRKAGRHGWIFGEELQAVGKRARGEVVVMLVEREPADGDDGVAQADALAGAQEIFEHELRLRPKDERSLAHGGEKLRRAVGAAARVNQAANLHQPGAGLVLVVREKRGLAVEQTQTDALGVVAQRAGELLVSLGIATEREQHVGTEPPPALVKHVRCRAFFGGYQRGLVVAMVEQFLRFRQFCGNRGRSRRRDSWSDGPAGGRTPPRGLRGIGRQGGRQRNGQAEAESGD